MTRVFFHFCALVVIGVILVLLWEHAWWVALWMAVQLPMLRVLYKIASDPRLP